MRIISVRDNENNRWKKNAKEERKKEKKKKKGDRSYSKKVRDKWLCWAFKSEDRELYESKHVVVECRCLKIWDLLSFLIWSSILVLKWRQVLPT